MDLAATLVGRERVDGFAPSNPREKALLLVAACLGVMGGYYLVGLTVDPGRATTLNTRLDDAIPLIPGLMYAYEGVYTASLFPLFIVRCQRLFRRTILGYALIALLCMVVWVILPVTSARLRPDLGHLDLSVFHNWGLRVNYALDPPLNLFPSLHVAAVLFSALCAWHIHRRVGAIALAITALVAFSVCAVKQHYALDAVAGAGVGALAYALVVRPYDPGDPQAPVAYSWRGPAAYLGLHGLAVLGFYLAFLAGWKPWTYPGTF